MAKSKQPSEFAKLAGSKKYTEAWKKARETEASEGFSDLPNGRYKVQITSAQCGVSKTKELYFMVSGVVAEGEHKGEKVSLYHSLEPTEFQTKNGTMRRMDFAVIAAKLMGYEFEGDSASPADFEGISEELNENKPIVWVRSQWKDVTKVDPKTKKSTTTPRCNMNIDGLFADKGGEIDDTDEEEVGDEESTEEEGDEEAGDEEETTDDEESGEAEEDEASIELKDTVLYKAPGTKNKEEYAVIALNENKETADIKHLQTKKVIKGVSLDVLELVFED